MSDAPTCKTCVFYANPQAEGTTAELGMCRRYPRHMEVAHGHWCGEHRLPETITLRGYDSKKFRVIRTPDGVVGFVEEES